MRLFQERILPDLSSNIKLGNSLIGTDYYLDKNIGLLNDLEIRKVNAFDWNKEFYNIFKQGGFDIVIGNPPWGALFDKPEKEYIKKYNCFEGNYESYFFFIERSLSLLHTQGLLSFITPDSWLQIPQARKLREIVSKFSDFNLIVSLPTKVFDSVSANTIIFLLSKSKNKISAKIKIMDTKAPLTQLINGGFKQEYKISNQQFSNSNNYVINIFQNKEIYDLLSKIFKNTIKASECLDVMQGIVPYSRENHSNEIVTKRLFHSETKLSDEYGMWVQGRAISRYYIDTTKHEYLKYGDWLHRPRKSKYFNGERILIQEITGGTPPRISATYYNSTLYHDPGIISCLNISTINIYLLLGLINSKLISWIHKYSSPKGNRNTFPKVLINDIRNFPIPLDEILKQIDTSSELIELVQELIKVKALNSKDPKVLLIDNNIDKLVYSLFKLSADEIYLIEET